jgi:hypothetical protein
MMHTLGRGNRGRLGFACLVRLGVGEILHTKYLYCTYLLWRLPVIIIMPGEIKPKVVFFYYLILSSSCTPISIHKAFSYADTTVVPV